MRVTEAMATGPARMAPFVCLRHGPRHPCPVTVRTIRLTIGKRRLMIPKHSRDARDIDQDRTVTSAAQQSSSRAIAFIGTHLLT